MSKLAESIPKKIIKSIDVSSPKLKRRTRLYDVFGTSSNNSNSLAITSSRDYAVACGYIVKIYSKDKRPKLINIQSSFSQTFDKAKSISAMDFSPDGKFLAIGEKGYQPSIKIIDLNKELVVVTLSMHSFGIKKVLFSSDSKFLISLGIENDDQLCIWNWKTGELVSKLLLPQPMNSICLAKGGDLLVACGNKLIIYWDVSPLSEAQKDANTKKPEGQALELLASEVILMRQKGENFVSIVGVPEEEEGNCCCAVTESGILVSVNKGMILDKWVDLKVKKAFHVDMNRNFLVCSCSNGVCRLFDPKTLKYQLTLPKPPKRRDLAAITDMRASEDSDVPDAVITRAFIDTPICVSLYSDSTILVWKICDNKVVGLVKSIYSHSGAVWNVSDTSFGFLTCCLRSLKTYSVVGAKIVQLSEYIAEGEVLKSLSVSPDERFVVIGDVNGKLRVIELDIVEERDIQDVHSAEILCVDVARIQGKICVASGGRDRSVVVSTVGEDMKLKTVLKMENFSSSIVNIKLREGKVYASGADNLLVINDLKFEGSALVITKRTTIAVSNGPLSTMDVGKFGKYMLCRSSDKAIRLYNTKKWENVRNYSVDGLTPTYLAFDSSGILILMSSAEKRLFLMDFFSGAIIAVAGGPSDLIRSATTTRCGSYLVVVGGPNCVFIWKLSRSLKRSIVKRQEKLAKKEAADAVAEAENHPLNISDGSQGSGNESLELDLNDPSPAHYWLETPRGRWAERFSEGITPIDVFSETGSVCSEFTEIADVEGENELEKEAEVEYFERRGEEETEHSFMPSVADTETASVASRSDPREPGERDKHAEFKEKQNEQISQESQCQRESIRHQNWDMVGVAETGEKHNLAMVDEDIPLVDDVAYTDGEIEEVKTKLAEIGIEIGEKVGNKHEKMDSLSEDPKRDENVIKETNLSPLETLAPLGPLGPLMEDDDDAGEGEVKEENIRRADSIEETSASEILNSKESDQEAADIKKKEVDEFVKLKEMEEGIIEIIKGLDLPIEANKEVHGTLLRIRRAIDEVLTEKFPSYLMQMVEEYSERIVERVTHELGAKVCKEEGAHQG